MLSAFVKETVHTIPVCHCEYKLQTEGRLEEEWFAGSSSHLFARIAHTVEENFIREFELTENTVYFFRNWYSLILFCIFCTLSTKF